MNTESQDRPRSTSQESESRTRTTTSQESNTRQTRQSKYGRANVNYNQKLHPDYDRQHRQSWYEKCTGTKLPDRGRRWSSAAASDVTSSSRSSGTWSFARSTSGEDAEQSSEEEPPTQREPDPKAIRRSTRPAASRFHNYSKKHHPQDRYLPHRRRTKSRSKSTPGIPGNPSGSQKRKRTLTQDNITITPRTITSPDDPIDLNDEQPVLDAVEEQDSSSGTISLPINVTSEPSSEAEEDDEEHKEDEIPESEDEVSDELLHENVTQISQHLSQRFNEIKQPTQHNDPEVRGDRRHHEEDLISDDDEAEEEEAYDDGDEIGMSQRSSNFLSSQRVPKQLTQQYDDQRIVGPDEDVTSIDEDYDSFHQNESSEPGSPTRPPQQTSWRNYEDPVALEDEDDSGATFEYPQPHRSSTMERHVVHNSSQHNGPVLVPSTNIPRAKGKQIREAFRDDTLAPALDVGPNLSIDVSGLMQFANEAQLAMLLSLQQKASQAQQASQSRQRPQATPRAAVLKRPTGRPSRMSQLQPAFSPTPRKRPAATMGGTPSGSPAMPTPMPGPSIMAQFVNLSQAQQPPRSSGAPGHVRRQREMMYSSPGSDLSQIDGAEPSPQSSAPKRVKRKQISSEIGGFED